MKLSIVILNWNGAAYLQRFLPFLLQHTPTDHVEIVVADNGSTDHSLEVLERDFPSVQTLVLDRNYGFAEGYNRALSRLNGSDYYLLLNSDVEVTPGWLQPMLSYMDTHADVAACQPKVLSWHQRTHFEYAGAAGGYMDRWGYPFCRGRVLGVLEEDKGQYDTTADVFWATGACLLVRAADFWAAGGLDAAFFAHMEEIDLCWRLRSRGRRVVCVPQSVVYHMGGGTLSAESPRKTYLNYRNNLLMLYKNLPKGDWRKVMLLRYFLDYLSAFHLLLTGRFSNAVMVFKARHDYKRMRSAYAAVRQANLQQTINFPIREIMPRSLVLRYYLCGENTYNKLMARCLKETCNEKEMK